MIKCEIEIINRYLNSKYDCDEVYFDDGTLIEKATMSRRQLPDNIFSDIAKAKRRENLKKTAFIGGC